MYMKMAADQDVDMASEIYASWRNLWERHQRSSQILQTNSLIGQYLYGVIKLKGYDGCKSDTKIGISYIEKVANQKVPHTTVK